VLGAGWLSLRAALPADHAWRAEGWGSSMAQTGPVHTAGSRLARADGRKPRRCMRKPSDEVRKVYSLAGKGLRYLAREKGLRAGQWMGAGRAALLAQPGRV